MNTNQQFRVFTARTAITLLVVLFANVTAWAQGFLYDNVRYTITSTDNLEACASVVEHKENTTQLIIHAQVTIGGKTYTVTSIGDGAFVGCANLETVIMEGSVPPSLGANVFEGCDNLSHITVPAGMLNDYMSASGWNDYLFNLVDTEGRSPFSGYCGDPNEDGGKHVSWFFDREIGILTISTEDTGSWKMANFTSKGAPWYHLRSYIKTLSFADNGFDAYLTSIGDYAFYGADLEELEIPYTVTKIGSNAFANNSRLARITLYRETPPTMSSDAFSECSIDNIFMPFPYFKNYKNNMAWVQYEDKFTPTCWFLNAGDESDPFIIEAPEQLDHVAELIKNHKKEKDMWGNQLDKYATKCYYVLGNDIQYTYENDNDNNFTAIGTLDNPFEGHFDGDGHTISGIRIFMGGNNTGTDNNQGLFACIGSTVGSSAEVKDVTLDDCRITGYKNVGGIAGRNWGTITGCRVTNTVTINAVSSTANNHGGIAGSNTGTIQNCISSANVISAPDLNSLWYYGGIVGNNGSYILKGNKVLGATVTSTSNGTHGAIAGNGNDGGTYQNNLYSNCTVGEESNNIGIGNYITKGSSIGATDIVKNNGARHVDRGDANADGSVSVTDIAVVVNEILQISNTIISFYGADANDDLNVTVTDIGVIVDMILGNSGGNASARRMTDEGPEPQ